MFNVSITIYLYSQPKPKSRAFMGKLYVITLFTLLISFNTNAQSTVDCAQGPVTNTFCYDSGVTETFTYTSSDGSSLNLSVSS